MPGWLCGYLQRRLPAAAAAAPIGGQGQQPVVLPPAAFLTDADYPEIGVVHPYKTGGLLPAELAFHRPIASSTAAARRSISS